MRGMIEEILINERKLEKWRERKYFIYFSLGLNRISRINGEEKWSEVTRALIDASFGWILNRVNITSSKIVPRA